MGTVVYFDPEFKALSESLSRRPARPTARRLRRFDYDGRKLLIHAGSDRDPGRDHVFDRDKKALTPAMMDRPELDGRQLASVKAVTIPASDGASIPAYLTLPPGKTAKNLPAIVLPHGGPSARDYWGFDWLSQFLAARGYAVLQPEYRGSAGWGDAWLNENGFKNWRTSIGDITASAKWLAAQGIADPDREAILGWSYGGYAALQSAATEPTLYKAVVAIAPVTDLGMFKTDYADFVNASLVEQEIGDGPHIVEGSPLRQAGKIVAPVLLFHGDHDSNVGIAHSAEDGGGAQVRRPAEPVVHFPGPRSPTRRQRSPDPDAGQDRSAARADDRSLRQRKGQLGTGPAALFATLKPELSESRIRSRGSAPFAPDRALRPASATRV